MSIPLTHITSSRILLAMLAWLVIFSVPANAEKETEKETEKEPEPECYQKEAGNWSYKMNDWEWKQPVENQKRWERETQGWWFNFGPTGVRVKFDKAAPRVAKVMYVYPHSPAGKKIFKGDEILGVNGKKFTSNEPFPPGRHGTSKSFAIAGPRLEVAKAIEESEGDPKRMGILSFTVKSKGKTSEVDVQLEQLGYFSPTFPYNCKKSRRLAEWGGDWLIKEGRGGRLAWGPPRMGDWIDLPAHMALLSFGDRYKKHFSPGGNGGVMWSWIAGIRLITVAEKQQILKDHSTLVKLEEMSKSYAAKSGPSGAYSHKTWYKGAPFQLAFAAGLNSLGQALAYKCGAKIDEESYLRTRYLLTCKTNEKGNIGYGASNPTPFSAQDARKAVGNIKPSIIKTDEEVTWRLVGGAACTTLTHFVDPRDKFSEAFVKRGVRHAMAARWTSRQSHGCGSLTFVYNTLAASIAPVVGEEEMYRKYMDDMKWWLNISRCHNGGWYFEPKIDTEANPYGRIHMTAAALLMLNAPLRELYVNGKGMSDPGVKAATRTVRTPSQPKPPAPTLHWSEHQKTPTASSTRKARTLSESNRKILDRSFLSALKGLSAAKKFDSTTIPLSISQRRVRVLTVGEDMKIVVSEPISKKSMGVGVEDLKPMDKAVLSILISKLAPESANAKAMAAVYLEAAGRVSKADKYFEMAGDAASPTLLGLLSEAP